MGSQLHFASPYCDNQRGDQYYGDGSYPERNAQHAGVKRNGIFSVRNVQYTRNFHHCGQCHRHIIIRH